MRILQALAVVTFLFAMQPSSYAQKNNTTISKQHAAQLVKKKYGGKILKIHSINKQSGYTVRVLQDNGKIISVVVDAKSGRLVKK